MGFDYVFRLLFNSLNFIPDYAKMVVSLKGLCLELDSIIISYFDAFDESIKLQNELNRLMKEGFLYMGKVR